MRLFIAVNIAKENKNKIVLIQSAIRKSSASVDLKWVAPENIHLTLKFLGEVGDARVGKICEKLRQAVVGVNKFEVVFEGIDAFPNSSSPRVLWLDVVKGKSELENLAQKIENLLTEIDFEKEKKQFSAHLTLSRFKSHKNQERIFDVIEKMPLEKIYDIVESIDLMKSTLTPRGPIYEVVEKFGLGEK